MPINLKPVGQEDETKARKKDQGRNLFQLTEPKYTFEDIVLSEETVSAVREIIALEDCKTLIFDEWGLGQVLHKKNSITVNLYGKSGTGKTMTAHAIADKLNKKLLIVDYSEIESKYVGETSKNLVNLFNNAKLKDAIILFDEADALLSKRVTAMNNATDVSVNQTRNVLLKLLDDYDGIVLFTTNFIQNFDSAFFRRIMDHIKFDFPKKEMRKKLWEHYLVEQLPVIGTRTEIIERLSNIEEVTGADIANAVLKTAVHMAVMGEHLADYTNFENEIKKILIARRDMDLNGFEITSRKVSEEFVREKIGKDMGK